MRLKAGDDGADYSDGEHPAIQTRRNAPKSAMPAAAQYVKSVSSQSTSSVNCIATNGSSNRKAAIIQGSVLPKLTRLQPALSVFPIALASCVRETLKLAWTIG
jgi:hypothetical protein